MLLDYLGLTRLEALGLAIVVVAFTAEVVFIPWAISLFLR
jgi:hypothetical protein